MRVCAPVSDRTALETLLCRRPPAEFAMPVHEYVHLDDGQSWPQLPIPPLRTLPTAKHRCPHPEAAGAIARPMQQPDAPIVQWTHALRRDEAWRVGGVEGQAETPRRVAAGGGSPSTSSTSSSAWTSAAADLEYGEYLVLQTPPQLRRKVGLATIGASLAARICRSGCLPPSTRLRVAPPGPRTPLLPSCTPRHTPLHPRRAGVLAVLGSALFRLFPHRVGQAARLAALRLRGRRPGPTDADVSRSSVLAIFEAAAAASGAAGGPRIRVRVEVCEAYLWTARAACATALCILRDRRQLAPQVSGHVPPVGGLGEPLIARLVDAGMAVSVQTTHEDRAAG